MELHVGKIARKIEINFRKNDSVYIFVIRWQWSYMTKTWKDVKQFHRYVRNNGQTEKIRKGEKVCVAMILWCMSIKNLQDEQRCRTALCLRVARTAFINLLYHKCLFDATAIVSGMRNFTKPGAKSCQKPCKATIRQIFPKKMKKGIDRGVEK